MRQLSGIRKVLLAGILLCLCVASSYSLTPAKRTLDVLVDFSAGSAELASGEKQRLEATVDRMRRDKWCGIEVAVVVGYAEVGEVPADKTQHLSEERAFSVAAYLQWLGLSPHVFYIEGLGTKSLRDYRRPGSNKHALFELVALPSQSKCPEDKIKNGFWR
jgi:hypothetical protein